MAKTCIVCNQRAGSGEHVFPSALGGRRVNNGIYCTKHNGSYSSLVAHLAEQMTVFNSWLGVVRDRPKQATTARGRELTTGEAIQLSSGAVKFIQSREVSRKKTEVGESVDMFFADDSAKKEWIAEQEASGFRIEIQAQSGPTPYYPGSAHFQATLGGVYGLGAAAYVTQTFLAQAFPDLARSGMLASFIEYTQAVARVANHACKFDPTIGQECAESVKLLAAKTELQRVLLPHGGSPPVWWDFQPQPDATPNAFEFGHRITVGVDSIDGQVFGRFSLFSSFNFSMIFGTTTPNMVTKTVTVDIDPLAPSPPNDIQTRVVQSAIARVERPSSPIAGLAAAIDDGSQQLVLAEFFRRSSEHSLLRTAKAIYEELAGSVTLNEADVEALVRRIVERESQRVWNMATRITEDFASKLEGDGQMAQAQRLLRMVEHDSTASSGLSSVANATLHLAKNALIEQLRSDVQKGAPEIDQIAMLFGGGLGMHVVGKAILEQFCSKLPQ